MDSVVGATDVLTDTFNVGVSRRRLLADADYTSAVDLLTAKKPTQDASSIDELSTTIAVEVARAEPENAPLVIESLMEKFKGAIDFAVVDKDIFCQGLQASHKVSEVLSVQTSSSLKDATPHISMLSAGLTQQVGASEYLNQECSNFVVDTADSGFKYQQTHGTDFGPSFMLEMS